MGKKVNHQEIIDNWKKAYARANKKAAPEMFYESGWFYIHYEGGHKGTPHRKSEVERMTLVLNRRYAEEKNYFNFMFDLQANPDGNVDVVVPIPPSEQDVKHSEIRIQFTESDLRQMLHVIEMKKIDQYVNSN